MWKSLKDRAEGVKEMKRMKTTEAVGQVLCHDITQIIPGVTKDAVSVRGISSGKKIYRCCSALERTLSISGKTMRR